MFEFHSSLRDSQSFSGVCLFCKPYLNSGPLFFGCSSTTPSPDMSFTNFLSHTHLQCPSTQSLHALTNSHRDIQTWDPSVPTVATGDHFYPVSTSGVRLEWGNLPLTPPTILHSSGKKHHSEGTTIPSPILPSQIHSPTMFGTSSLLPSYTHSYSACPPFLILWRAHFTRTFHRLERVLLQLSTKQDGDNWYFLSAMCWLMSESWASLHWQGSWNVLLMCRIWPLCFCCRHVHNRNTKSAGKKNI